jgi:hypothetical protein
MACDSGCCGPPKTPPDSTPKRQKQLVVGDGNDTCYHGGACGEHTEPGLPAITQLARNDCSYEDNNEPARRPSSRTAGMRIGCHRRVHTNFSDFQDACGSGPTKKAQDSVGSGPLGLEFDDSCCSANSIDNDCRNRICSAPDPSQAEDPNNPSCCKDRPSPCCDVSCLDRLALRACSSGKQAAQLGQASKSKHQCSLQLRC